MDADIQLTVFMKMTKRREEITLVSVGIPYLKQIGRNDDIIKKLHRNCACHTNITMQTKNGGRLVSWVSHGVTGSGRKEGQDREKMISMMNIS